MVLLKKTLSFEQHLAHYLHSLAIPFTQLHGRSWVFLGWHRITNYEQHIQCFSALAFCCFFTLWSLLTSCKYFFLDARFECAPLGLLWPFYCLQALRLFLEKGLTWCIFGNSSALKGLGRVECCSLMQTPVFSSLGYLSFGPLRRYMNLTCLCGAEPEKNHVGNVLNLYPGSF